MAMQLTHRDWGPFFTAEALECLEKERVWGASVSDTLLPPILTSQVLNVLNKQVAVVSAVMAALLPPALVALPCICLLIRALKEVV